ncbi:stimulus-sensing domain-containing protein [Oricola sp.]|uniref:stimulus-sensing domain-containing protein n=1 Tax=Oricola sp. TaxID=1979950 RepID=UPI000C90BA9F|nr:histidine kinase [Ahrensia sp.]|tara:strand:- start:17660 stop:19477 length:1818 start_codon:yes stop_codon:yes gene_type:complete
MTVEIDHNALRSGLDKKARAREGDGRREKAREESSGGRGGFLRSLRRFFGGYIFSSLTHRILFLNLAALGVLMSGILYINQFRDGLIDARVESLMIQGEIIAGAIAASANVETNAILIDPDKLLELQAGESIVPNADRFDNLDFPINPEKVAPVLRRLISPTRTRARIYDRDANLLLDSRHLYSGGQVLRYELPDVDESESGLLDRIDRIVSRIFRRRDLSVYTEQPGGSGTGYSEVMSALAGGRSQIVRISEQGELIVSVAVPVQRFRAVLGVLQLSTQGGDIDKIVKAERFAMMRVFAVAVIVNIILSIALAGTIANPLRRLAAAAVRVRRSIRLREEIPDFSSRQDEIGNLSVALRDMTNSLYARIDAIESFAADVSHELKNPLTSLRSAVETLPLAKNDDMRKRLTDVIEHDVRRLDRLISDISDASRLDAELVREDASIIDMARLLRELTDILGQSVAEGRGALKLHVEKLPAGVKGFFVAGHDLRIGQVITNLVQNAFSFVPEKGGRVDIRLAMEPRFIVVRVEDNGPGIRAENIENIFERFYTDRPGPDQFGKNSGLGLSISRQIVEAHGGTLTAENIPGGRGGQPAGACFIMRLPRE